MVCVGRQLRRRTHRHRHPAPGTRHPAPAASFNFQWFTYQRGIDIAKRVRGLKQQQTPAKGLIVSERVPCTRGGSSLNARQRKLQLTPCFLNYTHAPACRSAKSFHVLHWSNFHEGTVKVVGPERAHGTRRPRTSVLGQLRGDYNSASGTAPAANNPRHLRGNETNFASPRRPRRAAHPKPAVPCTPRRAVRAPARAAVSPRRPTGRQ